jgi:hypothetical protein
VGAIGHAFRVVEILGNDALPRGFTIGECLGVLTLLVLFLAAVFAAQAVLYRPRPGHADLKDAARLAAAAYACGILSSAYLTEVAFADPLPGSYRMQVILSGAFYAALLVAAIIAAVGFSGRSERFTRDRCLGWAGIAFAVGNLFALASGIFGIEFYSDLGEGGALTTGINLQTASFAAAAAAGAIAAFAFLEASNSGGSSEDRLARRDLLLAVAAGVLVVFYLLNGFGEAIVAIAGSGIGSSATTIASHWIDALGALVSAGAAICAAAAFQPAVRRAILRLA